MNHNRAAAMSDRERNSTNSIDSIVYSLCMNVPKKRQGRGGKEEDDRREEGVKISALLRRTKAGSYP
jgi:hypothetical protein